MRQASWKEVREELQARAVSGRGRHAEDFWAEFRARAALTPQAVAAAPAPRVLWPRLAAAVSAAAAACVVALVLLHGSGSSLRPPVIKSFEVLAPHSAVIILSDAERAGTILWVTEAEGPG